MSTTERAETARREPIGGSSSRTSPTRYCSCWSCGTTYINRGRHFCSIRCQEWFDAGNPTYEQQCEHERKLIKYPLAGLVVVAGPPGTVGRKPYAELFAAVAEARRERKRRKWKAA